MNDYKDDELYDLDDDEIETLCFSDDSIDVDKKGMSVGKWILIALISFACLIVICLFTGLIEQKIYGTRSIINRKVMQRSNDEKCYLAIEEELNSYFTMTNGEIDKTSLVGKLLYETDKHPTFDDGFIADYITPIRECRNKIYSELCNIKDRSTQFYQVVYFDIYNEINNPLIDDGNNIFDEATIYAYYNNSFSEQIELFYTLKLNYMDN